MRRSAIKGWTGRRVDAEIAWVLRRMPDLAGARDDSRRLEDHAGLIAWVASVVAGRFDVEPGPLIAPAAIGFLEAHRTYDPARGKRFLTHAVWGMVGAATTAARSDRYAARGTRRRHRVGADLGQVVAPDADRPSAAARRLLDEGLDALAGAGPVGLRGAHAIRRLYLSEGAERAIDFGGDDRGRKRVGYAVSVGLAVLRRYFEARGITDPDSIPDQSEG
jgi:hypothetical protein